MIKLTNILHQLKEGLDPVIDNAETFKLIKDKCFYDNAMPIYKGFQSLYTNKYKMIKITDNGIRRSANTSNHYTLLMSEILDSWKAYPKRNKCLVCSTSSLKAADFSGNGNAYLIYHNKNIKNIGVCSKGDLWDSFPYIKKKTKTEVMDVFNEDLDDLIRIYCNIKDSDRDAKFLMNAIKQLSANINKELDLDTFLSLSFECRTLRNVIIKEFNGNVYEALNTLLSPENNKFQLISIDELYNNPKYRGKEIWFELSGNSYGKLDE